MGNGIALKCSKCKKEYSINWGVGFSFPDVYKKTLKAIKKGKYGDKLKQLSQDTELVAAVIREVLANSFAHAIYGGRTHHEICIHPGMITIYRPGDYASKYMPEEYIKEHHESELRNDTISKMLYLCKRIDKWHQVYSLRKSILPKRNH